MKDLITAMRVLAEELDRQCKEMIEQVKVKPALIEEIGAATFCVSSQSEALKSAANRLEAELPKEGEWVEWSGDENPPETTNRIEVKYRCGEIVEWWSPAIPDWRHEYRDYDIIAYRVIP